MTETATQPPLKKPQGPTNASEAAANLLKSLPRVKSTENGQFYLGYYKGGNPVFTPMTLDRSIAMGVLQGIAEGRVTQGDRSIIGSLNVVFIKPLEDAIREASQSNQIQLENGAISKQSLPNPDISENQRLLNNLLNGIDWAASFGLFSDQALQTKRGRLEGAGFTATERNR